ncbi:DNA polymerase III PolC-type [Apilactobacillus kunkeei]|nr:DNA polymerase III PolC-type [Apilactobacillus kunkeei]
MSNQEELFTKLLNQLQLKDQIDSDNFKGGQIEKIDIHKRSKIWEFHLTLPRILDYEVFLDFYSRMQATFDEIATTKINIKANDNQFDNKQLGNYWEWIVKHADITDAIKNELLRRDAPKIVDHKIELSADNEIVKNFLVDKAVSPIEDLYERLGFPHFTISVFVDETASQEKIKDFKAEKERRMLS